MPPAARATSHTSGHRHVAARTAHQERLHMRAECVRSRRTACAEASLSGPAAGGRAVAAQCRAARSRASRSRPGPVERATPPAQSASGSGSAAAARPTPAQRKRGPRRRRALSGENVRGAPEPRSRRPVRWRIVRAGLVVSPRSQCVTLRPLAGCLPWRMAWRGASLPLVTGHDREGQRDHMSATRPPCLRRTAPRPLR